MASPSLLAERLARMTGYDRKPDSPFKPKQIGEKMVLIDGELRRVKVYESQYEFLRRCGLAANDARRPRRG